MSRMRASLVSAMHCSSRAVCCCRPPKTPLLFCNILVSTWGARHTSWSPYWFALFLFRVPSALRNSDKTWLSHLWIQQSRLKLDERPLEFLQHLRFGQLNSGQLDAELLHNVSRCRLQDIFFGGCPDQPDAKH